MRVATIFTYLTGSRRAILEIASDRRAIVVGALLVHSAALARNYDRASLVHEPWRLLGPFVASLAISSLLFLTIYGFARWKGMSGPGIHRAYLSFLALYWMTAPLAWLYGIPYERYHAPLDAINSNLWTLALVSLWRVALMVRVVMVIFGIPIAGAVSLVMLVADTFALIALAVVPLPVIHVMGGINPEQNAIAWFVLRVQLVCWLTLPLWIVVGAIAAWSCLGCAECAVLVTSRDSGNGRGALAFAALALVAWSAALPCTQAEQMLAYRVDQSYRRAGPGAALDLMSAHDPEEFPPGWQAPPRKFPGEPPFNEVVDILEAVDESRHAAWVCNRICDRLIEMEPSRVRTHRRS